MEANARESFQMRFILRISFHCKIVPRIRKWPIEEHRSNLTIVISFLLNSIPLTGGQYIRDVYIEGTESWNIYITIQSNCRLPQFQNEVFALGLGSSLFYWVEMGRLGKYPSQSNASTRLHSENRHVSIVCEQSLSGARDAMIERRAANPWAARSAGAESFSSFPPSSPRFYT